MSGITLIEVLVGFVIFMASLVAILDYVANQVHLRRSSAEGMERAAAIYDRVLQADYPDGAMDTGRPGRSPVSVEQSASRMLDSYTYRGQEIELQQVDYLAHSPGGSFQWSVIEIH